MDGGGAATFAEKGELSAAASEASPTDSWSERHRREGGRTGPGAPGSGVRRAISMHPVGCPTGHGYARLRIVPTLEHMFHLHSVTRLEVRGSLATLAVAVLAACGGQAPQFDVHGVLVSVRSDASFTTRQDFPSRVEKTVDAALQYWGGSWSNLQGASIVFDSGSHVGCAGHSDATGCYENGELSVSTSDASFTYYCVEETVLVHEVGHAVIGNPDHTDPRWMDFTTVMDSLQGLTGYSGSAEVQCPIFVSVWRHPPTP